MALEDARSLVLTILSDLKDTVSRLHQVVVEPESHKALDFVWDEIQKREVSLRSELQKAFEAPAAPIDEAPPSPQ